jgi:hypothetical protein
MPSSIRDAWGHGQNTERDVMSKHEEMKQQIAALLRQAEEARRKEALTEIDPMMNSLYLTTSDHGIKLRKSAFGGEGGMKAQYRDAVSDN